MTDQPNRSSSTTPNWGAAAATLGVIGVLGGITALLPLPLWGTIAIGLWLLLCLIAWLGTLDGASRAHIARSLRDSRFTQLYRFTVNRQLKLLWKRFCHPVDHEADPWASFRAALTRRLYGGALMIAVPLAWMCAALLVLMEGLSDVHAALLLFLAFLPLLNAAVDVVSYAVTLTLIRRGLQMAQPLLYGLFDFAIALVLFLVLGGLVTGVISGLNALAETPILDLAGLFASIAAEPHEYWWLYAMLFSTLVPTALHAALSLLGAQALAPLALRRPAAALLDGSEASAWKAVAAPLAVGAVWALPVFAAGGIVTGLWWIGADALALLAGVYLDLLTAFAAWIGAL
jgi:hypothetical protein